MAFPISDLIRKAALGIKPRVQMATPERAALIKGLAELGKIGSNVNQVAKALNFQVATGQEPMLSGQHVTHTLVAIQTLSAHLLQHLTNGHQG